MNFYKDQVTWNILYKPYSSQTLKPKSKNLNPYKSLLGHQLVGIRFLDTRLYEVTRKRKLEVQPRVFRGLKSSKT